MLTLDKFEEATEVVAKVTQPTKLVYSEFLSTQTDNKVYLKPENLQTTGAYKIRGAYYKISTLTEEERANSPSLILRRMAAGETLWDIAKQYRTDEDAIRNANHLEEGSEATGLLLIPKLR